MPIVGGLELRQQRGRLAFVLVTLQDGALDRVDRIPADAVWQETLRLDLVGVQALAVGPATFPDGTIEQRLVAEAVAVATSAETLAKPVDPDVAYAMLDGGGERRPLPERGSLEGFQARIDRLHAAGLRPNRIYGGVGLLEPNEVLDATALAWWASQGFPEKMGEGTST